MGSLIKARRLEPATAHAATFGHPYTAHQPTWISRPSRVTVCFTGTS